MGFTCFNLELVCAALRPRRMVMVVVQARHVGIRARVSSATVLCFEIGQIYARQGLAVVLEGRVGDA